MKREITVKVNGEVTDQIKKNFSDRLAIIIFKQFGLDGVKWALEELKKQKD